MIIKPGYTLRLEQLMGGVGRVLGRAGLSVNPCISNRGYNFFLQGFDGKEDVKVIVTIQAFDDDGYVDLHVYTTDAILESKIAECISKGYIEAHEPPIEPSTPG